MDFAILILKNPPYEIDTLVIFQKSKQERNDADIFPFLVTLVSLCAI